MIFAIGHDIAEVSRIKHLFNNYGHAFLQKILSSDEIDIFIHEHKNAHYLAKRFAAKEAFAKACGTGFRLPILLSNISVINDNLGKPYFKFSHEINEWLEFRQIKHCHLSISDEKNLASACVILEK